MITDHNVRETLGICDKATIINDGTVLANGSPNQIIDDETEHNIEPENVDIEQCDEKLDTIEEEEVTQSPTPSIEEIEKPKKKRTYKKKNVISV